MDFDCVAGLVTHKGAADGGVAGDFAFFELHLVVADYSAGHSGIGGQIGEDHLAEQGNLAFGQGVGVDDAGVLQHILQEAYAADGPCLGTARCTVLEILAQVTLGPGFRELVLDARVFHVYEILELSHYLVVAFL